MPRKLGSRWLMFWKIMRRDYRRSEMFYQGSHGNWNRGNNKLLNFIKFPKNIKLDPASSQGQKPPGLVRIVFSLPQCSTSQFMPKEKGRALLRGDRQLIREKDREYAKASPRQSFFADYAKEIFLQASQPLALSEPSDILHPTVNWFLKARAPSTGFWPEAWLITWNWENDEFWNSHPVLQTQQFH